MWGAILLCSIDSMQSGLQWIFSLNFKCFKSEICKNCGLIKLYTYHHKAYVKHKLLIFFSSNKQHDKRGFSEIKSSKLRIAARPVQKYILLQGMVNLEYK